MTLIQADELKKNFNVTARFYFSEMKGEKFLMRREARIERRGILQKEVDAAVVMINPGSCKPEGDVASMSSQEAKLMPAKPDQTQYQLMNLMERKNWNVLVIINLSDICEGNLENFKAIERKFKAATLPHSIFEKDRTAECVELLATTKHLIFAWGSSKEAKRLSSQFGLYKNGRPTPQFNHIKAWIHSEKGFPRHPKPATVSDKIIWLNTMETLL